MCKHENIETTIPQVQARGIVVEVLTFVSQLWYNKYEKNRSVEKLWNI
jgi:hypothetical protein|nr:MAG TPA: hypothetical protein [Caudoviricetes sp.]